MSTHAGLKVDFQEAAMDGRVTILRDHQYPDWLPVGTLVRLFDDDGNETQGTIVQIGEHVLWIEPALEQMRLSAAGGTQP